VRERIIVGLDYDNLNMIGYEDFQFQFNEVPVIEVLVLEVHERELEKVEWVPEKVKREPKKFGRELEKAKQVNMEFTITPVN
jgi:hypothetical protein